MKQQSITGIDEITENLIEIAWVDQYLMDTGKYKDDIDSRDRKFTINELAIQFLRENIARDFELDGDYYDAIMNFAEQKLLAKYGKEN